MNKAVHYFVIGAVALVAGASAAWWQARTPAHAADAAVSPSPPKPIWSAHFKDLDGHLHALSEWRGKPVAINFWATWCGPCKEEMPGFEAESKTLAGKAAIVGIAVDNAPAVRKFTHELGIDYPILVGDADALDMVKQLGDHLGLLPFTVIYDARGRRIVAHPGRLSQAQLDGYLNSVAPTQGNSSTAQPPVTRASAG